MVREDLIVMTEERLEGLSERFVAGSVRAFTGVDFATYLRDPDHYDRVAVQFRDAFRAGRASQAA